MEYYQIISEYYDLSDYHTKRKLIFCNEAEKMTTIEKIVGKIYGHIKSNCTGIDFGTIPNSKGVITKVDNYQNIIDCLNSVKALAMEYHEDTKLVDNLLTTADNIQKRERVFNKAFALNIDLPIMIYNISVMSIVAGTSLLISTSVEFVKNGHDSFQMSFDRASYKKSKDHVLYQYSDQFNRECSKGTIDKVLESSIRNNMTSSNMKNIYHEDAYDDGYQIGAFAGMAKGIFGLITGFFGIIGTLFGMIRLSIYYFLRMRMKLSDWFANQAEFLQINANNIKYREGDSATKKAIYQKQMKMVENFKKISNMIALKDSKAQKESKEDERDYKNKHKYEDDNQDDRTNNDDNDNGSSDGGLF